MYESHYIYKEQYISSFGTCLKKSAHKRVKIQVRGNALSFFKNLEDVLSFYNGVSISRVAKTCSCFIIAQEHC